MIWLISYLVAIVSHLCFVFSFLVYSSSFGATCITDTKKVLVASLARQTSSAKRFTVNNLWHTHRFECRLVLACQHCCGGVSLDGVALFERVESFGRCFTIKMADGYCACGSGNVGSRSSTSFCANINTKPPVVELEIRGLAGS